MSDALNEMRVMEIIRSIDSGATRPVQCRLEDELVYAVKGRAAQARGLLGEVYSAHLGQMIGLPIPSFTLARISRHLLESHSDVNVRGALGHETLFGSLWQEPVESFKPPSIRAMPPRLLATVYVFDHWIQNGDRTLTDHGGNANLLVGLADRALIVIDHNLAFMPGYEPSELLVHACRPAWLDVRADLVFKSELEQGMRKAMGTLVELQRGLPEEWLDQEPGFIQEAASALARIDQPQFWAELG